jgi:hypothetical protein
LVSDATQEGARTVLLIGEGDLSDEVATALESAGAEVERLERPDEGQVREAIESKSVDSVAVVARDDAVVLRMALIVRSISAEAPLVLTIFDETMAEQVAGELPNTHVTSLADIVAPSLAGPCIDERATARGRHRSRLGHHGARRQPARCRPPRGFMVPSYPASGTGRTADPGAGCTCLTVRTPS